jgi:hypothetical protein
MILVAMVSLVRSRWVKLAGVVVVLVTMSLTYPRGYTYNHQESALQMGELKYMRYLRVHNDGRFLSLYPPLFPNIGMVWNLSDIRASDALQPKAYWRMLLEVNGGDEKYMQDYFFAAGLIGPMPEAAVNPKLKKLGLQYIVSPGDLGGAIMVNYLVRTANVKVPGRKYFYWSLWDIGGDHRPVLFTHPPALIELPDRMPLESEKISLAVAFNPMTPPGTDGAFMSVVDEAGGKRRVIYCRHIIQDNERGWVPVPQLPPAPSGTKRYLIVHPCLDNEHDWVGWGYKSVEKTIAGFKPVLDGDVMIYKAMEPPRKAILIDENGVILVPGPMVTMNFPDEYVVKTSGRDGKLILNFLGYRPGWRAWAGGNELYIRGSDKSVKIKSEAGSIVLKYQPVSFAIGLWVSIVFAAFGIGVYLWPLKR